MPCSKSPRPYFIHHQPAISVNHQTHWLTCIYKSLLSKTPFANQNLLIRLTTDWKRVVKKINHNVTRKRQYIFLTMSYHGVCVQWRPVMFFMLFSCYFGINMCHISVCKQCKKKIKRRYIIELIKTNMVSFLFS